MFSHVAMFPYMGTYSEFLLRELWNSDMRLTKKQEGKKKMEETFSHGINFQMSHIDLSASMHIHTR